MAAKFEGKKIIKFLGIKFYDFSITRNFVVSVFISCGTISPGNEIIYLQYRQLILISRIYPLITTELGGLIRR